MASPPGDYPLPPGGGPGGTTEIISQMGGGAWRRGIGGAFDIPKNADRVWCIDLTESGKKDGDGLANAMNVARLQGHLDSGDVAKRDVILFANEGRKEFDMNAAGGRDGLILKNLTAVTLMTQPFEAPLDPITLEPSTRINNTECFLKNTNALSSNVFTLDGCEGIGFFGMRGNAFTNENSFISMAYASGAASSRTSNITLDSCGIAAYPLALNFNKALNSINVVNSAFVQNAQDLYHRPDTGVFSAIYAAKCIFGYALGGTISIDLDDVAAAFLSNYIYGPLSAYTFIKVTTLKAPFYLFTFQDNFVTGWGSSDVVLNIPDTLGYNYTIKGNRSTRKEQIATLNMTTQSLVLDPLYFINDRGEMYIEVDMQNMQNGDASVIYVEESYDAGSTWPHVLETRSLDPVPTTQTKELFGPYPAIFSYNNRKRVRYNATTWRNVPVSWRMKEW